MAIRNQQALYELIDEKLEENSYDVNFNVDLYNAGTSKYYTTDDEGQRHRFVPTMITDVVGEYLNIPNANSTSNQVGISFEIFADKKGELSDKDITELKNVEYTNTLNAIEEFKNSLLAKYFPLGTPYLYMGGTDSSMKFGGGTTSPKVFYMKFTPYNSDAETIITQGTSTDYNIDKNGTTIRFEYTTAGYITIPYTENVEKEFVVYYDGTDWNIKDTDGNSDSATVAFVGTSATYFELGKTTGFEGLIKEVAIDFNEITSFDFTDTEDLIDYKFYFVDWNDRYIANNSGTQELNIEDINNCILWSLDGNAIFGFKTLNPITNIRPIDGTYYYQEFELEMDVFISNDVLFGNLFEYTIDDIKLYPVDRQHTLATDMGSAQYIDGNYNGHIVEESSREHTMSFYYIPNKKLTTILKHVVSGAIEQNTVYELIVQYPFFKVTYDVIIENGGTSPNINTLSTFTVTFKRKDASLS